MRKPSVDFVQGADLLAPGVSRVQQPLLQAITDVGRFNLRPVRFSTMNSAAFYGFLYGLLPARLLAGNADLVHVANAWYAHVVPILRKPAIVTCHHPIGEEDLRQDGVDPAPHRIFHYHACLRGMSRSRLLICDSDHVSRYVESILPAVRGRVRTVYPGISPVFQARPTDADDRPWRTTTGPYVLFVGSEQARKNLPRLVQALAAASRLIPSLEFIKVGRHQTETGREEFIRSLTENHFLASTTIIDDVPDDELAALYRGAAVTVLPSLQEGFGFPPLEAMACGCPVIVSDRGSLPEVTRGAAAVVDPLNVEELTQVILTIVSNDVVRREMRARGLREARHFSWKAAADSYMSAFDEALRRR